MEPEEMTHAPNGRSVSPGGVEIEDTIVVERAISDASGAGGEEEFEVVGIVEDSDSSVRYAVCYSESADEFIVTDQAGALLRDEALAQDILEDFLEQADGTVDEET